MTELLGGVAVAVGTMLAMVAADRSDPAPAA